MQLMDLDEMLNRVCLRLRLSPSVVIALGLCPNVTIMSCACVQTVKPYAPL